MDRRNITNRTLQTLKTPAKGERKEIMDRTVAQFGVRTSHTGKHKFILFTRFPGGKYPERRVLGTVGAMSLQAARKKAQQWINMIDEGWDPEQEEEKRRLEEQRKKEHNFAKMVEAFLAHCAAHHLRPRTIECYQQYLTNRFVKELAPMPVAAIEWSHLLKVINTYRGKKQMTAARLARASFSAFFGYCLEELLIPANPVGKITLETRPKRRDLSLEQVRIIVAAAERIGGYQGAFIRTLILTAQRRNETSLMRWEHLRGLEGTEPLWLIPAENAKNGRSHDVPLSVEATTTLRSLKTRETGFVFTFEGAAPISAFSKLKTKLDKEIAAVEIEQKVREHERLMGGYTLHDLRRSAVTLMIENKCALPHIAEAVINHISGHKAGIAGVYNLSVYPEERRAALTLWGGVVTGKSMAPLHLVA